MKNYFNFMAITLCCVCSCSTDSDLPAPLSDKELDRVYGPVKTSHIVQGDAYEENGVIKYLYFDNDPDIPESVEFSIYDMKYNTKGEYTWVFCINEGDTLKKMYLFNEKDERVGYDYYINKYFVGRMKVETTWNDWRIKEYFYKSYDIKTNKYHEKRVYQLDSLRRVIREKNFDENRKGKSYTEYTYIGESNNIQAAKVTDLEGNVIETLDFVYKDGYLYQTMIYNKELMDDYGVYQISEYEDYDQYGNFRKRRQYYVDGLGKRLNYAQDITYTYYE